MAQLTNRLREHRLRSGLTQEEVADRLDKSRTTVSRHESGNQEFTLDDLERYAKIYNCSPITLLIDLPVVPETPEEIEALTFFRQVDDADRLLALQLLRKLVARR